MRARKPADFQAATGSILNDKTVQRLVVPKPCGSAGGSPLNRAASAPLAMEYLGNRCRAAHPVGSRCPRLSVLASRDAADPWWRPFDTAPCRPACVQTGCWRLRQWRRWWSADAGAGAVPGRPMKGFTGDRTEGWTGWISAAHRRSCGPDRGRCDAHVSALIMPSMPAERTLEGGAVEGVWRDGPYPDSAGVMVRGCIVIGGSDPAVELGSEDLFGGQDRRQHRRQFPFQTVAKVGSDSTQWCPGKDKLTSSASGSVNWRWGRLHNDKLTSPENQTTPLERDDWRAAPRGDETVGDGRLAGGCACSCVPWMRVRCR